MNTSVLSVLTFLLCMKAKFALSLTCMDDKNSPVDWFVVYKLPEDHKSSNPLVHEGLGHFYLDVNSQTWRLSDKSLNSSGHAIYNTLQQVYKNAAAKDVAYLMYNDEKPAGQTSLSHGHTKGDLAFDKTSGFWLVHSLPRFPPEAKSAYAWPHSGLPYGQTFLCVTYNYKYFNVIGEQLMYTYPWVYDSNLPDSLAGDNPNLVAVINKKHVKTQPWQNKVLLNSKAGQAFTSYAKFKDFDADLYDAWVAPSLQSNLLTETWQNGRDKDTSNCTAKYQVMNIEYMQIGEIDFKETRDHSKWAVTSGGKEKWICIGGINRMESQKERAGGTVCANLPKVWDAFNSSVTKVEKCPRQAYNNQHQNRILKKPTL